MNERFYKGPHRRSTGLLSVEVSISPVKMYKTPNENRSHTTLMEVRIPFEWRLKRLHFSYEKMYWYIFFIN